MSEQVTRILLDPLQEVTMRQVTLQFKVAQSQHHRAVNFVGNRVKGADLPQPFGLKDLAQ